MSASPSAATKRAPDRAMVLAADAWLDTMEREYLADFLPAGGGAVRFVVADQGMLDREALTELATYRWPDPGRLVLLPALAEANGVAPELMRRDLLRALTQTIWRDPVLTQDFRHAMIALLMARLTGEDAALAEAVMGWLGDSLRSLGQVRQVPIGRRIGRQNARAVLMSLCRWVRGCGGGGILLLLDIRQLHRERRALTEGLVYTPAAVMDCYEVLRQVIDDAEHFPGLLVVAVADDAFLSDDPRRSLGQYAALQMRVWDDVRPQGADNPLAPLVRLIA